MSEQYEYDNMSTQDFLDTMEIMILQNPEMDGIELEDSEGRSWFIQLTSENPRAMN